MPGIHRVNEMPPLPESTHNNRFVCLMDRFMLDWQYRRNELNKLPFRHEAWDY